MIHSGHEKKAPGIISVTQVTCRASGAEAIAHRMPESAPDQSALTSATAEFGISAGAGQADLQIQATR
jgi:hypothetical protein